MAIPSMVSKSYVTPWYPALPIARRLPNYAAPSSFLLEVRVAEERRWRKIDAPKPWRPRPGETLVGIYAGASKKVGPHGEYSVFFVRDENYPTSWTINGARIEALFVSVQPGARIRVVFNGREEFVGAEGVVMEAKDFDLYVEVIEQSGETIHEALATPPSSPW